MSLKLTIPEEGESLCHWCETPFVRKSGGNRQRFCTADCRHLFHKAARLYTEHLVRDGYLTMQGLKSWATGVSKND